MRVPSRLSQLVCAVSIGVLSAACNTTPTLPLPPPLATVSTVDEQGFALVSGEVEPFAYVSILNEQSEQGVITRADVAGVYEAKIAAEIGDLLTIWQLVGTEISEQKRVNVPAPR